MTDEQASNWAYRMICCLGISTSNSDINVVGLHKTIKDLYDQGRADERKACAKLCDDLQLTDLVIRDWADGTYDCAKAIRARSNHENAPLP